MQTIPRRASAAAALPLAPPRPTVTPTPTPTPSGFSVTIAKSQITVGGTQYYTLTGAPINMPVYGAVYITPPGGGEYLYQNAYWGNTNGVGGFAIGSIPYTSSMVGTIRVVFTVAGKSRSVTFTCTAGNTTPGGNTGSGGFGLSVASAPLSVGQTQWYSVSGAPAYSAVWGAVYITPPGGREYLFQNAQWVPSSGNGTFGVGSIPYTSGMVGTIRVVLTIGGVSATVTFTCK